MQGKSARMKKGDLMYKGQWRSLLVEAAASSSSSHFGVGNVAQLHAHHPEPKGCILIGHQLQRGDAVQLVQLLCNIKRKGIPAHTVTAQTLEIY